MADFLKLGRAALDTALGRLDSLLIVGTREFSILAVACLLLLGGGEQIVDLFRFLVVFGLSGFIQFLPVNRYELNTLRRTVE